MLKKTMFAALAASALLGGTGLCAAHAQHGPGPGGWHHDPLFAGVSLSDSQQQQMAALRQSSWQSSRTLFEQVHAIDQKIDDALLSSGSVDEASLATLVQQKSALMAQLDAARLSQQIAERNLLTSDQLATASSTHAKLVALHQQERALHGDQAGFGPGDMPPPAN